MIYKTMTMATKIANRYTLQDFSNIIFNGFDISLPDETLKMIGDLTSQVGSPTYIKTPTFHKVEMGDRERPSSQQEKKKKRIKQVEVLNDEDWETLRSFQATKMVQKEGLDIEIDLIRSCLNKMTEKNYGDQCLQIVDILNRLSFEDMTKVGNAIFEIASNNRFYSKLYADLYTELISKFVTMHTIFEKNLQVFLEIFENIEHANADENYDEFCRVNKNNERRKALSSFFVNLTINRIIKVEKIIELNHQLLDNVMKFIKEENKKSDFVPSHTRTKTSSN
jgi:hypothetical protein